MLSGKSMARSRPTALGSMLQASTYGVTIPSIYGRIKSPLLVIWAQNLRKGDSGKKGKKKGVTTYVEQIDFMIGSNPIQGLLQFWGNNNSRYPLNFVEYSTTLSGASTIVIPDSNFYFLIGVTVEVVRSGTFNDYGGQGSNAWGPVTMEYPLWNAVQHGPDLVNASGARFYPFIYKWLIGDGATVTLPFINAFSAPAWGIPNGNGNIHFYYAQLSAENKHQVPATTFRLTFEPQLGNNNAAYAGFTSQQIIYPEYAGASSPNIDLGAAGMIQDTRAEVMGAFSVYPTGDADFFDMIEDVLKSGMMQVGSALGLIHRGVNLNDLPGPIQKNLFAQLEPLNPKLRYWQANGAGNVLIAFNSWRVGGTATAPTISDDATNTWNPIFVSGAGFNVGMWYAKAVAAPPGNGVQFVFGTPGFPFDAHPFILEMDPGSQTVDATNSASGTTAGAGVVTCSITTTGPAYIVAMFNCHQGFIVPIASGSPWKNLFPASDGSQSGVYGRHVSAAGTYTFSLGLSGSTVWSIGMIAVKGTQSAPQYAKALGDILDPTTAAIARAGCRANGLFGSASLDSQRTAADWLTDLYECANSVPVWSGFRLKSIFRSEVSAFGNGAIYVAPTAAGPVMNISEDDLIGDSAGPLITVIDKTPGIDAANILQIEFVDRSSDYNPSLASWPEQSSVAIFGPKKGGATDDQSTGSPQTLHEIMDPLVARKLLAIQARRNSLVVPRTYKFKGKAQLQLLEPMDMVTINDSLLGISQVPVRITSCAEDDKHDIDFEAEPFFYGVHAPDPELVVTATTPYQPNSNITPASVNLPIIFEPVPRLSEKTSPQLWAVVSDVDPNYGGCAVYISTDGGTSYNLVGQINGNAVTGVTTADWPPANDPDTTHDLPIDLTESLGSLISYQVADEDNFVYPCYIAGGNATIPYGLMAYAVATLTAANKYTLKATGGGTNHLRRCVFGAPAVLTDVDHPLGSRWAFLNPSGQGIFKIAMDPKWIGVTLKFKFLAFNTFQGGVQALATATAYSYTPTGLPSSSSSSPQNTYTQSPAIALSQPSAVQIAMAQVSEQFNSGSANYNARTFTIPDPGGTPTVYYVTIADSAQLGDTGALTNLTATCQTSNALVGQPGNIYVGFIIATHAAGATATPAPGGWPPPSSFIVD